MKKTLTLSLISSIILMAGSPIHDLMDNRIKGKSYTGTLDDNAAAEDGLGILPLQSYGTTTDVNNELLVQKVLSRIIKSESDKSKTVNIKDSLNSGIVGSLSDLNYVNSLTGGTSVSIVSNDTYDNMVNTIKTTSGTLILPKKVYNISSVPSAGTSSYYGRGILGDIPKENLNNRTIDFGGSIINASADFSSESGSSFVQLDAFTNGLTIKNLTIRANSTNNSAIWSLFSNVKNYYGPASYSVTFENCIFDFSQETSYSYMFYHNGFTPNFINSKVIVDSVHGNYVNVSPINQTLPTYLSPSSTEGQSLTNQIITTINSAH